MNTDSEEIKQLHTG